MNVRPRKTEIDKALQLLDRLQQAYPGARCALQFAGPWQLLVATILSAQCTDVRVNQVTPALFARFADAAAMAAADPEEVETLIRSTGFYRNKARHLIGCAVQILSSHDGQVPASMDALTAMAGVGRKTANVVLGNAFGVPGMVVDTHVGRLARRFGWTGARDPVHVEHDLCCLLPAERWTLASHLLIEHGRARCRAQTAWCSGCCVAQLCPRIGVERQR